LDRLTKSKEAALLDAERTVQSALAKASMVDDLQNKNQELMKQIEICQVCLYHFFYILEHQNRVSLPFLTTVVALFVDTLVKIGRE
jgi:hypothetical protein